MKVFIFSHIEPEFHARMELIAAGFKMWIDFPPAWELVPL